MGKASSSKKVARAAGIGGGRTNRGKAPVLWYSSLVVILVAGIGLTAFSRDQRVAELSSPESREAPRAGMDHWHVAVGVRACDRWLDPLSTQADNKGIHTHADGLIHVEPSVAAAAGRRATFERFAEAVKGEVAVDRFAWPVGGGKKEERRTGEKCGEQEAEVKAFYNGELHEGDPSDIRLTDNGRLVLAFVPKGTTYEQIGDPPSASELPKQGAPPPGQQPEQVAPAGGAGSVPPPPGGTEQPSPQPSVSDAPAGSTPPSSTPTAPVPASSPSSTPG